MKADEVDVDGIQRRLGSGRFQILTFLVLGLIYSRGAWHVFGIMFLAGDPGHKCALPQRAVEGEDTDSVPPSPFSGIVTSDPRSTTDASLNLTGVSGLPTTLGVHSRMTHAYQEEGVGVVKSNWTADSCAVSYTTHNGSSVTLIKECPNGWSYGSVFETTVLSEVMIQ